MGIEIKWIYLKGELIKQSWDMRTRTKDASSKIELLIKTHEAYLSSNSHLQVILAKCNSIKKEIKEHVVKLKKGSPPQDLVKDLKAEEAKAKQYQTIVKEHLAKLEKQLSFIPNIVDPSNNNPLPVGKVVSLGNIFEHTSVKPLEFLDNSKWEYSMMNEFMKARFGSVNRDVESRSPKMKRGLDLLSLYKRRWLDESSELPVVTHQFRDDLKKVEMCVICCGETQWSRNIFRILTNCACEYYCRVASSGSSKFDPKFTDNIKMIPVPPFELSNECSMTTRILIGAECVAEIMCTTDYESREYEIRCGSKKHLQSWKKYVHVVRASWYLLGLEALGESESCRYIDFAKVEQISFAPEEPSEMLEGVAHDVDIPEVVPIKIQTLDDVVNLDIWLIEHSFVKGSFFSSADVDALAELDLFLETNMTSLPPVQYPHITRWLNTIR